MAENLAVAAIEKQQWMDPVADGLQKAVGGAFEAAGPAGQQAKNFLHGVWLGHPLHAMVTDVPVGAWTAAVVMDAMDDINHSKALRAGADAAVAVGLVGAVASAASGLADWQPLNEYDAKPRRVGLTHALLNVTGATLFGASLVMRKKDQRGAGRGLAMLGYLCTMAAGYLGGKLVYREQLGVDHTIGQELPHEFTPVLAESELAEGQMKRVNTEKARILVAKQNGQIYAINEVCSHLGGPLAEGKLEDGCVVCPWHGSRFALGSGEVIDGPAVHPQPCLETRVNDGQIEVRAVQE